MIKIRLEGNLSELQSAIREISKVVKLEQASSFVTADNRPVSTDDHNRNPSMIGRYYIEVSLIDTQIKEKG